MLESLDELTWWCLSWIGSITWYSALIGIVLFVVLGAIGDMVLTTVAQIYLKTYVGSSFRIRWSLLHGTLNVENLSLSPALLDASIAAFFPATVEKADLASFAITIPLLSILYCTVTSDLDAIPTWGILIGGLDFVLNVDPASKWRWRADENKDRFAAAVAEALQARLQLVEAHTMLIKSKLDTLATPPKPAAPGLLGRMTEIIMEKLQVTSLLGRVIDASAQKVDVSLTNVSVVLRPPNAKTSKIHFKWRAVRLCTSQLAHEFDEERAIQLLGIGLAIAPEDTSKGTASSSTYVLNPFDLRIKATYAPIMRGLMKTHKNIGITVDWPHLHLAIEPPQLAVINMILAPMADQSMWIAQAKLADEQQCIEIPDVEQYRKDYGVFTALEQRGMASKVFAVASQKIKESLSWVAWNAGGKKNKWTLPVNEEVLCTTRVEEIERRSLVMDLLGLRRDALKWKIPSYGQELPHVSEKMKAAADLIKFLDTPIEHYYSPSKQSDAPLFDSLVIDFALHHVTIECWSATETQLIEFYVDEVSMRIQMATGVSSMMDVDIVVHSFGLNDLRHSKTNVFPHILGRNPDCTDMIHIDYRVDGKADTTVQCEVANFSFLLITSPLVETMNAFTIEEDEETLIWKEDPLPLPPSPPVIYMAQVESTHNPSMLGGMSLDATVLLKGCEVCLLADPSSYTSHILALTCDMDIKAQSNKMFESLTLTLSDVALQPCKVQMTPDGIDLELPGLRTLLELEGDGVDVEVHYELRTHIPVEAPKRLTASASTATATEGTKRAWGVLRKAVKEGNVPEADEPKTPVASGAGTAISGVFGERKFRLKVSDFALNLSKEDIGLFGAIQMRLGEQLEVSEEHAAAAAAKEARVAEARKLRLEQEQLTRLHHQFDSLDTDGGGSLDHGELMKLVESLVAEMGLTAEETQKCHEKLVKQVDTDHSGDVSFGEFQAALNPVEMPYSLLHQGTVQLTAQEYANPRLKRSIVPRVHALTGQPVHLNDSAALAVFWKKYESQVGVSRTSLHQQAPRVVQEKMIRVFRSYEFAQEAWNRLVNPNLKPTEQSPWVVLPHEIAGQGVALFEKKLTSGGTLDSAVAKATSINTGFTGIDMTQFVQTPVVLKTELHTEFGGFYFRMVDKMLPARTPALEFAVEDVQLHGMLTTKENNVKQTMVEGVLTFNSAIYCKYYNTSARQLEPFIEYYPLQMVVKKEADWDMECLLVSDHHLQMNVTATFVRAVTTTSAAFYDAPINSDEVEREHIKVLKGLCWMYNEVGVPFTYYVQSRHATTVELVSDKVEVDPLKYGICKLLNEEEDLKGAMAENLKEKEMRAAFRAADNDNSGELDADEVREVLRSVMKSYDSLTLAEIDEHVRDFMALADTDNSGLVSWKEFQSALAKTRTVAMRTLSIEVANYEPIHGITLDGLGEEVIVELIPTITEPWIEGDIESMYTTGVAYLNQEVVSVDDLNRGVHLLHLVADIDPRYKWTQSYLATHEPDFCPRLLAIHITVDNTHGMTVTVKTAEYVRNETAKLTEVLLLDENGEPSVLNPRQDNQENERFVSLAPYSNFSVPLPLLEHGFYSIRQVGESAWSNNLPLSVWSGRKTRQDVTLYESIDDQPTTIERLKQGGWALVIGPQLIIVNALPCVVEYVIVQKADVNLNRGSNLSTLATVDDNWFGSVNEVNCRHMTIESGASMQVSGLRLDEPAYMKVRLMAEKDRPVGGWSQPFEVAVNAAMEQYGASSTVSLPAGPSIEFKHSWNKQVPRTMEIYVPYWIQNRSGLDLNFKIPHGQYCTWQQHEKYFGKGFHEIPLLVNAPATKATISVQPYQATPFDYDFQSSLGSEVRKYLPDFKSLKHSQPVDMTVVWTNGEISCGVSECVLGYEVIAAPSQFQLSKIVVLLPRYVVVNQVERPLQFTPLTIAKTLPVDVAKINVVLKPQHTLIVYRFMGKDKQVPALRCRDALLNDMWQEPGPWCPVVPLNLKQATCMWLRGPLGHAPYVEMEVQPSGAKTFVMVKDRTLSPSIRIENRSTQFAIRYVQSGVKHAEEMVLPPMTWHSYAWDNPFHPDLLLKVFVDTSRVPEPVNLMHMTKLNNLTPDGGNVKLHGEVYIDGNTRVLAVGDEPVFHENRRQAEEDIFRDMALDIGLHGVGITIVDAAPREVMNITLDGIRVLSPAHSNSMTYDLHHLQIDDMTPRSMFPVVICPTETGYNSNKKEGWLIEDGETPFFHMVIDSYNDAGMVILDQLFVALGSLDIKLNLDYILYILDVFWAILYPPQTQEEIERAGMTEVNAILTKRLSVPDVASLGQLMYFKKCSIQPYNLNVILNSTPGDSDSGLSKMLGSTAGSIIGGIAHVAPEFSIKGISREDKFLFYDDFLWNTVIYDALVGSCINQWYKVVGSIEVLGDPVGLLHEVTDGLALALRQTKRDFTGKSRHKGEGAVTLVQAVIGAPSNAIGKVSNGVGDLLKKATNFESQEMEREPRHVPEGVFQGGLVLGLSIAHGVSGLVTKPIDGMKEKGFGGFAKGIGQGAAGLVASPFIGAIGALEKLSQSVHNTTHLLDEKHFEGTRRIARKGALKAIEDSPLLADTEVRIEAVSGVPIKSNVKVYVSLYELSPDSPNRLGKLVDTFKTKTKRHVMGEAVLDQSRIVDVTSIDMALVFEVVHKRKPLPKKLLGKLQLTMEQVYELFPAMPKRSKVNSTIKEHLKSRKVHNGSIFDKSLDDKNRRSVPAETGWEAAYHRAASIIDGERESLGSQRSLSSLRSRESLRQSSMSNVSAGSNESEGKIPHIVRTFPLEDADEGSPMLHLSIRYFKTLRS
ncbi:unnamed protein product [Aphanomyces euteiches]